MVALSELLEEERTDACGPRYRHQPGRKARRAGHVRGELVMGGRRVSVQRPRARTVDDREVELPSWRHFSVEDPLHERALTQMLVGVSTRKYERSLERVAEPVKTRGTSKSAVSRRFVAITKAQMDDWFARDLSDIDVVVVMLDGVHIAEHVILVAVGIDSDGKKHVLGIREGATENATACRELLVELRQRGLSTEKATLFVLDGAKALRKAVVDVWAERAKIQRCQAHYPELAVIPVGVGSAVGEMERELGINQALQRGEERLETGRCRPPARGARLAQTSAPPECFEYLPLHLQVGCQ